MEDTLSEDPGGRQYETRVMEWDGASGEGRGEWSDENVCWMETVVGWPSEGTKW